MWYVTLWSCTFKHLKDSDHLVCGRGLLTQLPYGVAWSCSNYCVLVATLCFAQSSGVIVLRAPGVPQDRQSPVHSLREMLTDNPLNVSLSIPPPRIDDKQLPIHTDCEMFAVNPRNVDCHPPSLNDRHKSWGRTFDPLWPTLNSLIV